MKKLDIPTVKAILMDLLYTQRVDYILKNPQVASSVEIARFAVEKNPDLLQAFSRSIRDDKDIVKLAITEKPSVFRYASRRLQLCEEFTDQLMKGDPFRFTFLHPDARMNKEYVVAFLAAYPEKAYEVPKRFFSKNKDITRKLLKEMGRDLEHMPRSVKNDPDMVKLAVVSYYDAFKYASDRLKNNVEMVKFVIEKRPSAFRFAFKGFGLPVNKVLYRSLALKAISKDGELIAELDEKFRSDREAVFLAVANDGSTLKYVSEDLQNDLELCKIAVANDSDAIRQVPIKLRYDVEVLDTLLSKNLFKLRGLLNITDSGLKEKSLAELRKLMKTKSQDYFVNAMLNAAFYMNSIHPALKERAHECVDLLLENATISTLSTIKKGVAKDNEYLDECVNEAIARMSILDIEQKSATIEQNKKKSRKFLKP